MISGTPIFEGLDDLKGELNFLRIEPFSAGTEDGFWNFAIGNPFAIKHGEGLEKMSYLKSVVLRRSKDMTFARDGTPILGLPAKTVRYVPVLLTSSERTFYSFVEFMVNEALRDKIAAVSGDTAADDDRR